MEKFGYSWIMVPNKQRFFDAEVELTAQEWFKNPIQDIEFILDGEYSQSADGACPGTLPCGKTGFIKPRPGANNLMVCVREKIVSDLGYALRIPVAPVLIQQKQAGGGLVNIQCISLACFRQGRIWGNGGEQFRSLLGSQLEALRVFWTWIGDIDHGEHGGNLIYQIAGVPAVAAIDHSYSLCHSNSLNPLAVSESQGYGTKGLPEFETVREDTINAILSLDFEQVETLVHRLDSVLTFGTSGVIVKILRDRREGLRALLGVEERV